MISVVKPGLSTTVQDGGREGYYNVGIPPSGALDGFSLIAANLLVGNPPGAAGLECAYLGPELRFDEDAVVAVCGAEMTPRVDGSERALWEAFRVPAGSSLSFAHLRGGARAYVAVAGGIDVPSLLGSRSTYVLGGLGGFEGRPLAAGDVLPVGSASGPPTSVAVPEELRPTFGTELEIRVVMGLYDHLLTPEGRRTFLETEWTLTPTADRVGFRYKGEKLELLDREQPFGAGSDPSNIVDAPYPIGSIQVPGGVEPIVLHRDAVSGGGYAMIATVISSDMDAVAQSAPGAKTRFVPVDLEAALTARAERNRRLAKLQEALS
ncbi:MAG TPA: biotin-dependent carboxyltransferase family protein [Solirubrobacter sp.]|nr:biotin-dependent carboxyltransferase family protein [Solirubrobacter sp.]